MKLNLTFHHLVFAIILWTCQSAWSIPSLQLKTDQGAPVFVHALNYDGDSDKHIMQLSDEVVVIYNEQSIHCDRATINDLTNEIIAEGHLVIDSATVHMEGQKAHLNYKTNLGYVENGFIQSGQVLFEGEKITKTGPEKYLAENGYYTACASCPPAWGFRGREIDAQVGGYARLKSVIFEIANVPVLWLPYLIVPLKSDRQSGFLIPQLYIQPSNPDGHGLQFGFSETYFWAISRSQDASFTLKTTPANGVKTLVNHRFLLSEQSSSELNAGAIRDKNFFANPKVISYSDTSLPPVDNSFIRWFFRYQNHFELPDGYTQNTKLNLVSDFLYPVDHIEDYSNIPYQGERAIDNRFTLTKNTNYSHASVDASYYINILKADPLNGRQGSILAGNQDAVHRMPEIRYSLINTRIANTPLLFKSDLNYVHFARQNVAYDDIYTVSDTQKCADNTANIYGHCVDNNRGQDASSTSQTGTGQFNPEVDMIRAGDRFDFQPEVSLPFQIGQILDVVPSVNFRFTQYAFDVTPDSAFQSPTVANSPSTISFNTHPIRSYFSEKVSFRTRLSGVWDGDPREDEQNQPLPSNRYKHEIAPEIIVTSISGMNESTSVFFNSNSNLPIFLGDQPITDSDLFLKNNKLQFDYNDRIINRNVVTGILSNKIIKKTQNTNSDSPSYLQIIGLKIWQSYDLDASSKKPYYPWSDIDGLVDLRFKNMESYILLRYFPYHNVTNTSLRAKFFNNRNYLQLTYNQYFKITQDLDEVNYDRASAHIETLAVGVGTQRRYLLVNTDINLTPTDINNFKFKTTSWTGLLKVIPPGNCWAIGVKLLQALDGSATQISLNFDYQFGGGK